MDALIDNLRSLFPTVKESSFLAKQLLCSISGSPNEYNPLNLIISAFAVPWRASYYTLLAILQQSVLQHGMVIRDYPPELPPPPLARAVVYESLHSYPPVRHIRQETRVDVEAIQQDPTYWGPDAKRFDPARFLDIHRKINQSLVTAGSAWMPFVVGSMRCSTAGGYSVRLIAVIVGELLRQMLPTNGVLQWGLEGDEWDCPARQGDALQAGREEYGHVNLMVGRPPHAVLEN
ncbi:hypothetical protein MMC20_001147 [Loxospora ochrophaea]|nr:hypothetical protein [Loxospora ochrophaea]